MSDFKVGQLVKLVKTLDQGLSVEIGAVGTIEEITNDPEYPINVAWLGNEFVEGVDPSEIRIVKDGIEEDTDCKHKSLNYLRNN